MDSKVLIVFLISCFVGALCQKLCIDSCPLNEVFSECKGGGTCQKTCSTRKTTDVECACVSGCICKTGYFRDADTYKCIKESSCPPIPELNSKFCPKNEVYSESLAGCESSCGFPSRGRCPATSGCICKTGYTRSPITNQCILITSCEKCPPRYYLDSKTKRCELICDMCMDVNAEFNACGDRCKELTCDNPLLEGIVCPALAKCEPGCFCKAGYVKDPKTNKCIPPKSCPNPCKDPNAVYSNCGTNSTCDMQTCRFPNGQGDACLKVCQKGCFCKPGYVKNDSEMCVLPRYCPKPTCKKNEIYECRNPTCEPGCLIKPCVSVNCENKCYCKDGYVKENGTCILLATCKKCDDPNATYNNCEPGCSDATCLNPSGLDLTCKGLFCRAGCFCMNGYIEDHTGKCILPEKCPKCPENESFFCDNAACEKNCGNLNETCTIQSIKCDYKCFCNEGFVRETPYGPCIPISKCPPNKCESNEVFECRNPTCDDEGCCIENKRPCEDVPCVDKCYCADGFVRIDGVCVPRENCFKDECPANEIMDCRNPTCDDEGCCVEKGRPCEDVPCVDKCYCADGFVRIDGVCVPRENCFKDECPANEIMDCRTCLNEGCFSSGKPCSDEPCEKKCYCADELVRINGVCVFREKCNELCTDPNSSYNSCGSACEEGQRYCQDVCVEGCFCNAGYIKDSSGVCILIEKSPNLSCKDPNAEYTCGNPYCETTCKTIGKPCDVRIECVNKCYCKAGYVLSDSGICIPIEKCPIVDPLPIICKDPNSSYNSCLGLDCEPTCSKNATFCPIECEAGCFCNKGFIREYTSGPCIPIDKCPTCPANEVIDCRDPTCGEQGCFGSCKPKPGVPCVRKCFCADDYRRINGICIPKEKCPNELITCNADETFECRKTGLASCEYKCYCAPGLVKIDGKCVPENKCSIANTEYRTCVNPCTEPSCAHPRTAHLECPYACVDGCFCIEGYVKNDDGSCIPEDKCPNLCPRTCLANENCLCQAAKCDRFCGNRLFDCKPDTVKCVYKCFCEEGFIRSFQAGGACVPEIFCNSDTS